MNLDLSRWAAQLPENEQPGPECELDEFTAEEAVAVATTTAPSLQSPKAGLPARSRPRAGGFCARSGAKAVKTAPLRETGWPPGGSRAARFFGSRSERNRKECELS